MSVPCYGCESRKVGCHAVCPSYTTWRAEQNKHLEEKHKAMEAVSWTCSKKKTATERIKCKFDKWKK